MYTFEIWFATPLPLKISVISTSSGENMTFLGDPMWVIWYTDKRLEARPGTYKTLLNWPWSRSILPLPKLSVRESSPVLLVDLSTCQVRWMHPWLKPYVLKLHNQWWNWVSLMCQQPMHELSLCLLNLILLLSSLSCLEGRCHYSSSSCSSSWNLVAPLGTCSCLSFDQVAF